MTKTERVTTRLSEDMMARLDAIVAASIGDRSDHIRAAISDYIARHEPAPQGQAPSPLTPVS